MTIRWIGSTPHKPISEEAKTKNEHMAIRLGLSGFYDVYEKYLNRCIANQNNFPPILTYREFVSKVVELEASENQ